MTAPAPTATRSLRRPHRSTLLVLVLGLVLPVLVRTPAAHGQDDAPVPTSSVVPTVMLVVDTSGSMSEEDGDGGIKIEGSRAALIEFLAQAEPATRIGLRTYPGPTASDCNTGTLDIGIDERDPSRMDATIRSLTPDGDTPTAEALTAAADDLARAGERSATIVLVSDGESTCEDPCVTAATLDSGGTDIKVLAIGLAASEDAVAELTCIAEATDGAYIDASDTDALADIFDDLARPTLEVTLDHPAQAVAEAGPDEAGRVTITGTIANTGEVLARDARASIDFQGTVVTTSPRRALGNLDIGDETTVQWTFRPGVSLVNNSEGRSTVTFEVLVTAANLRAEVRAQGSIEIVDAAGREDAGPVLRDAETIAILGDSYSSGEGAGDYLSGTDVAGNHCHQSRLTYLVDDFGIADDRILACSGAVTHHIANANPDNDVEAQVRQLREVQERGEPVDLVVLTLGGNDIGFGPILESCLISPLSCTNRIGWSATDRYVNSRMASLSINLWNAYQDIDAVLNERSVVERRGGNARILVLAYPRILPGADRPCAALTTMDQAELDFGSALITRLNGAVEAATLIAARLGVPVTFVPTTEDAFLPGHTVCDGSRAYVRSPGTIRLGPNGETLASIIRNTPRGQMFTLLDEIGRRAPELFHPNRDGYAALGRALVRWSLSDSAPTGPVQRTRGPRDVPPGAERAAPSAISLGAVTDAVVQPGSVTRIEEDGYRPVSYVELTIESELRVLGSTIADEEGVIDTSVVIPRDLERGTHTLSVLGVDPAGEPHIQEVELDLSGHRWPVPVPLMVVGLLLVFLAAGLTLVGRPRRGRARRETTLDGAP